MFFFGFGGHWRHFRDWLPKKFFWKDLYEGLFFLERGMLMMMSPSFGFGKEWGLWLVTLPIIGTHLFVYMTWCMPHLDMKTTYFLHQLNMFEPHHVYTTWKVYIMRGIHIGILDPVPNDLCQSCDMIPQVVKTLPWRYDDILILRFGHCWTTWYQFCSRIWLLDLWWEF